MLNKILGSDCEQDSMWAKGVLETIGESKVKMLEKVLDILESKDQSKINKIEGGKVRIVLVIHPWRPRIEGIVKKYSGVILCCSHLEPLDLQGMHLHKKWRT